MCAIIILTVRCVKENIFCSVYRLSYFTPLVKTVKGVIISIGVNMWPQLYRHVTNSASATENLINCKDTIFVYQYFQTFCFNVCKKLLILCCNNIMLDIFSFFVALFLKAKMLLVLADENIIVISEHSMMFIWRKHVYIFWTKLEIVTLSEGDCTLSRNVLKTRLSRSAWIWKSQPVE